MCIFSQKQGRRQAGNDEDGPRVAAMCVWMWILYFMRLTTEWESLPWSAVRSVKRLPILRIVSSSVNISYLLRRIIILCFEMLKLYSNVV